MYCTAAITQELQFCSLNQNFLHRSNVYHKIETAKLRAMNTFLEFHRTHFDKYCTTKLHIITFYSTGQFSQYLCQSTTWAFTGSPICEHSSPRREPRKIMPLVIIALSNLPMAYCQSKYKKAVLCTNHRDTVADFIGACGDLSCQIAEMLQLLLLRCGEDLDKNMIPG